MISFVADQTSVPGGTALPLSQAVVAQGLVFVSGQLALRDGRIVGDDVAEQTTVIFDRIEDLLQRVGSSLGHILKTTVWLTRAQDYGAFNQVYMERLNAPWPARATVVATLLIPSALIEIDAVAVVAT